MLYMKFNAHLMLIPCNSFHFVIATAAVVVMILAISCAKHSLMNNNYVSNACVAFDHAHSTYKEF